MSYFWWSLPRYAAPPLPRGIKVISTVPGPILPIEVLRAQCEIGAIDGDSDAESHPDDEMLLSCFEAAVEHAEDFTGLSIALRTYELALDTYPALTAWDRVGVVELPRPPLIRVDSFLAVGGGSEGELDEGGDYLIDDFRVPARIVPVSSWPSFTAGTNAIRIRYVAGYVAEGYSVSDFTESDYLGAQRLPMVIRQALLLLTRHFWENRSDTAEKALTTIPNGFLALLRPRRVELGMA